MSTRIAARNSLAWWHAVWLAAAFFALSTPARALDNGLARTPPMGWNSWNKFGCDVNEQLVRDIADAMAASGMKAAGYQYVIVDDCWQSARDAAGDIVADPARFPSGMKALADYVHARGLEFGLYSDAGEFTCQRRPGSRGHEPQDARQYAAWGVDYLKYDWCSAAGADAPTAYRTMRDALAQAGRPIVFSICEWGESRPWTWAGAVGNLWRTTGDIKDCFDCQGRAPGPPPGAPPPGAAPPPTAGGPMPAMGLGVLQIVDQQASLGSAAGPGGWNDPDMLEVGNGGMTFDEYRAHFALWAMLAAPLIAGNDLRTMNAATRGILTRRDVIAVDQDPLGTQGRRLRQSGDLDLWVRPLAGGDWAVLLLNRGTTELTATVNWSELGLPARAALQLRDLWSGKNLGRRRTGFSAPLSAHSALFLRARL